MTIYKLGEDPNVFITPTYFGNKFVYRMAHIARESNSRTLIRNIDLRKDTLMVRKSVIQESVLQRLHDSLTLSNKQGHIYVNCDGACYFLFTGKGVLCKPIHNVIFDWSPFGIVVSKVINDSLRKQLEEKAKEVKEVQEGKNLELKKVIEQLSLVDFELESTKIELESCKKAVHLSNEKVMDLEKQLSTCKKVSEDKEAQVRDMESELKSTKLDLQRSRVNVEEVEYELSSTKKSNEEFVTQVKELHEQLSSINSELDLTKTELHKAESSPCKAEKENHHLGNKMRELSEELHSINFEVRSNNRKVEQVLISMLWNELFLGHQPQTSRLRSQLLSSEDEDEADNLPYMLPNAQITDQTTNNLPVSIKIEDIDEKCL